MHIYEFAFVRPTVKPVVRFLVTPLPMKSRFASSLALLGCVLASPLALQAQPQQNPRAAQVLYSQLCANCHGPQMQGNRAPSMLDETWAHGGEDADLARSIRDGWPGTEMPGFKAVFSEPEIRAMVVYIRETRARAASGIVAGGGGGRRGGPPPPPPNPDGRVVKSALTNYKIERIATDLQIPWGMQFLPDGRLIVSERTGRISIIKPGQGVVETVTGLPPIWVRQDGGLLDLALHPKYGTPGNDWVYLAFSEVGGDAPNSSSTRIIRARIRDSKLVDQETLFQPRPDQYWADNTHFGARFLFDQAGFLYYSIGDRGHRDDAQDLTSPYGKIHRIRDDGSIPADNPFVNTPGAVKSIWSYGNRNVQGIAQHPVTGEIWATEHGARGGDELNVIRPGRNYGWPVITYGMNDNGTPITDLTEKEGMEQPITYWTPSIAVSALEFYTGDKFPQWKNQLFMAALAGTQFRRIELDGSKVVKQEILFNDLGRVREVVQGPDGYLYIALNTQAPTGPSQIIRLVPATAAEAANAVTAPLTIIPPPAPAPALPAPVAPGAPMAPSATPVMPAAPATPAPTAPTAK